MASLQSMLSLQTNAELHAAEEWVKKNVCYMENVDAVNAFSEGGGSKNNKKMERSYG